MQQDMDDVNVCDICGDIGEEDKLAICSRCNDGAEHTYCLQVMIEDVPEGDWLCEECRNKVDIEEKDKKLEISQVKAGTVSSKNKAGIEHEAVPNGRIKKQRELKICGICGDAGEQEKLAVCSRCNDGAEHIYCMQVMMEEVPDVGWLCEACQSEMESEKKTNKMQNGVKNGAFKGLPAEGRLFNLVNNANTRSSKNGTVAEYVGREEYEIGSPDNYVVTRKKDEAEASATSCVGQNLHEPGGLSIQTDNRKRVLSRGSSFKSNMEKDMHAPSQVSNPLAPIAPKNKAQPDHGLLSKSVSFNNAKSPKVKQLGYEVHLRPQLLKESSSCIAEKVGPTSTLAPSTSFKKPNFRDPTPEAKTSMMIPAQVTRVMSQNVKYNRGSSIAHPSVSAPMVAPVVSQAATTEAVLSCGDPDRYQSFVMVFKGIYHVLLHQNCLRWQRNSLLKSNCRNFLVRVCGLQNFMKIVTVLIFFSLLEILRAMNVITAN